MRSERETNLIIDIGSGSVATAVVSISTDINLAPQILYISRKEIKYYGGLNSRRFLFSMITALEGSLSDIQKDFISKGKNIKINNIHCFFSSLWHISQMRVLKSESIKEIKITKSIINKMIEDGEKNFELCQTKDNKTDFSKNDIQIIEKKIMQIKLNGYETADPYHKIAKTIEMDFFISSVSKNIIKIFEDSLFRFFNDTKIYYHTFVNSVFTTLRDLNSSIDDYIFLDISGEITEVAIVKNGVLFDSVSFPLGKNTMVRKLSETLETNKEEALSRISLYKSDNLVEFSKSKISKAIDDTMRDWHQLLDLSIKKLLSNIALPQVVFFMSDDDIKTLIGDFIKLYKFDDIDTFGKLVEIKFIENEVFDKHIVYQDNISRDQFLSLETVFLNKIKNL
ncbi:MAG: hypothetical protein WC849_00880 [Candidatus Paceibacterota bacterium]